MYTRQALEAMTVAELRGLITGVPSSVKKAGLVERILRAQDARERRRRWEEEILARGHASLMDTINEVRRIAGLVPVASFERCDDPIEEALARDTDHDAFATTSYLSLVGARGIVAEALVDEWGYEFARRMARGEYSEWGTVGR